MYQIATYLRFFEERVLQVTQPIEGMMGISNFETICELVI